MGKARAGGAVHSLVCLCVLLLLLLCCCCSGSAIAEVTANAVQIILDTARLLMRATQSLAHLKTSLLARQHAVRRPHSDERTTLGCHELQAGCKSVRYKPRLAF